QSGGMDGDDEDQRRDDDGAGQGFERMEAHGCPSGRRTTGVVHGVGEPERVRAMHPTVGPVEPGVMQEQVEPDRYRYPPQRIGAPVRVDLRPPTLLPTPGDEAGG